MSAFRSLESEPCPNCGLPAGAPGHGMELASIETDAGRQVYLLCRECAGAAQRGELLNDERVRENLARRRVPVPFG